MDAVATLWAEAGLPAEVLPWLEIEGEDPVLPSSFALGRAAASAIGAAGLAAALLWRERGGHAQRVRVALQDAALECRSEQLLRVGGEPPPAPWDAIAGLYPTADGWARIHTNFPHHRDGFLDLLGCSYDRGAVAETLRSWPALAFEDASAARGLPAAAYCSLSEWDAHPQARAIAGLPLVELASVSDAAPEALPPSPRPLSGVRVLDLSRIIAGPVAGRTLAAHGADVLAISGPHLPSIESAVIDTGRGKLTAALDLRTPAGRTQLEQLIRAADVFIQAYRPGALAALGFGLDHLTRLRPGLVCVSLSAWSRNGPWAGRRGFDSLAQTATGLNSAEAQAAGQSTPRPLPAQVLDHATGHLMAFGAMAGLHRRATRGGSSHIQLSLARTALWLRAFGRVEGGFAIPDPGQHSYLEPSQSGFGPLLAAPHAARLDATPARYGRPAMPLGSHAALWPPRPGCVARTSRTTACSAASKPGPVPDTMP